MDTSNCDRRAVNLKFSHMGLSVSDIDRMEAFYTGVLGFTVTDRGDVAGLKLVFLSRDPLDHHQIVLATGRPDNLPPNTINPQFGPSINQISFKLGTLDDLRHLRQRLDEFGTTNLFLGNHGIAWSIYAHDPEGNNLEFFVDSDWYITQPFLIPLDLNKTDEEIIAETRAMCEAKEGFEPYVDWRQRIAARMTPFMAPTAGA